MTTPLSRIAALFVLNRWYQNEAVRARDAYARPEEVWRRCVAGAWRHESPTEDRTCFPQATVVDRGVPRVKPSHIMRKKPQKNFQVAQMFREETRHNINFVLAKTIHFILHIEKNQLGKVVLGHQMLFSNIKN